jgi:hypothetical protein
MSNQTNLPPSFVSTFGFIVRCSSPINVLYSHGFITAQNDISRTLHSQVVFLMVQMLHSTNNLFTEAITYGSGTTTRIRRSRLSSLVTALVHLQFSDLVYH